MELAARQLELARGRAEPEVGGAHGIVLAKAKALHRTVSDVEQRGEVGLVAVGEQQAVARHEADELGEGLLHRGHVRKNVGVVQLQVVHNRDLGQVVDEFAALVEERGVVFVALDDEPLAVREPRARAQVARNASNQVAGIQPRALEHPCEQRRGGGLPVCAAHNETAFAPDEKLLEQLRQRAIAELAVQHGLDLGIAAGNGVADDDQVGLVRQVLLGVAGDDLDLPLGQERGHGRIHIRVRARDAVTALLHRRRRTGHRRAADSHKMNRLDVRTHAPMMGEAGGVERRNSRTEEILLLRRPAWLTFPRFRSGSTGHLSDFELSHHAYAACWSEATSKVISPPRRACQPCRRLRETPLR